MKKWLLLGLPLTGFVCGIYVIYLVFGGVLLPAAVETAADFAFWAKEDIYEWALTIPGEQYGGEGYGSAGGYGRIDYLRIDVPAGFLCKMSSTVLTDCYDAVRPGYANHDGIDYGIAPDMTVITPINGVITHAGPLGAFGQLVVIENQNYQVLLAHNNSLKIGVGDLVTAGQGVALSGSTGNSSGSHIHFEVRRCSDQTGGCSPVDPLAVYLPGQTEACDWYFGKTVTVTYLSGFTYTCGSGE